ncbi:shikimate dehydrogenase [Pseudogemmobacter sonorensis]|uniref:shikimate dehydrogenase n=1 Tax=Pseudogemmobacter sonorensis TaxID=2989681 RepID=UPI00368B3661
MSDHRIPLAAVLGHPVAHSRSPALHGYWLRRYGLQGHYIPMDVAPQDLNQVIAMMPRMGFVGANVTIPHKEAILSIADIVTDRAALIGAANTLIFRKDGKIHADNTDGAGFIANLRQQAPGWNPAAGPAVVLGAGGASRAVVAALIEVGAPEIWLANRSRPRAEALRSDFGAKIVVHEWSTVWQVLDDCATLVNTTSLGMVGKPPLQINMERLGPQTLVTDLVYTPLQTQFLAEARVCGCPTVDGLGMLLHQAAPGFERWFGQKPEVDEATRQAVLTA